MYCVEKHAKIAAGLEELTKYKAKVTKNNQPQFAEKIAKLWCFQKYYKIIELTYKAPWLIIV